MFTPDCKINQTHDLWVCDFMSEGPYVLNNGELLPTYSCLIISRYVIDGRYCHRQNLSALQDSLLRTWPAYGISKTLYLDNVKIDHAAAWQSVCHSTPIRLLWRQGYINEEMTFGVPQSQFEAYIGTGNILTLNELNRRFAAYVNAHTKICDETGQSPKNHYQQHPSRNIRIDRKLSSQCTLPFLEFVQNMAALIKLEQGLTEFSAQEYKILKIAYNHPALNKPLLVKTCKKAVHKMILFVDHELELMTQEGDK